MRYYMIVESKKDMIKYYQEIKQNFFDFYEGEIRFENMNNIIIMKTSIKKENEILTELLNSLSIELFTPIRLYHSTGFINKTDQTVDFDLKLRLFTSLNWDNNILLYDDKLLIKKLYIRDWDYELSKSVLGKYIKDLEMIRTVRVFLNNNLNAVQTAKDLNVHRNTLLQRLKKFQDETGFDIRKFDDAFVIYLFTR